MHPRLRNLLLATTPLLALGLTKASAGPEGALVVGGAATIQGQGGPAVIVNQSTSSAVINWNTFNIRANESVRFNQPNSSSVALNRVVGGLGPSEIMGSLTANGRVFIINRDGILFGPGSVVNTAGFLATTNDIKNADFMAGRYNFNIPGRPDASIVNQGRITATSGGFAALVAPGVRLPQQQALAPMPGPAPGPSADRQNLPRGFARRIIDVPPPTETRMKTDEVMVQIRSDVGVERLRAAVAPLGVSITASEDLPILGSTAVRLHIDNGRSPAEVIRALAAVQLIAVAQPQYVYGLDQQAGTPLPAARSESQTGDDAQYILQKLNLPEVHRIVRGSDVPIAVIDSEIDAGHPDLEGRITQRYDAVGVPDKPHPHGTGMAGAIAAHQRLLGTAPAARLLAVHAFSTSEPAAESTTFNILKGINWAVGQGVRVINMSFAGPKDPSLERALKAAYDRNIVLIAFAGNAGPKSPPLYPGAYSNVIAVTATDVDDKLFA